MSWRSKSGLQPANNKPATVKSMERVSDGLILIAHLGHRFRVHTRKEFRRFGQIELFVGRFDAKKESVAGSVLEPWNREERTVRLRQLVQRKHDKNGKGGGAENGQFESHGNKSRPAVQGT